MKWDLTNIRTFLAVAHHGSFVGAAKHLGLSPPAVSRAVSKLELEFGHELFFRTTRSVSLTTEGRDLATSLEPLIADLGDVFKQFELYDTHPRGKLRISMPLAFGRAEGVGWITAFQELYPEIEIDLSLDDHDVDLAADGFDLVVRIGPLGDSASLIAQGLEPDPLILCATSSYLTKHGTPKSVEELRKHNCINFRNRKTGKIYSWRFRENEQIISRVFHGSLVSDDGHCAAAAGAAGLGICQMPGYLYRSFPSGTFQEILPALRPDNVSITALYLRRDFLPLKMKVLIEFLKAQKSK